MKTTTTTLLAAFAAVSLSHAASAAVVNLEFQSDGAQGGIFDFNAQTGTLLDIEGSGVDLFFEAYVGGVAGDSGDELNATTSAFGINESTTGDDTDELDTAFGAEAIRITFSGPTGLRIVLDSITIASYAGTGGTAQILTLGSPTPILGNSTILFGDRVDGGLTLEVAASGDAVFSFDGLQFTTTAVPEPTTTLMLGIAGLVVGATRRRKMVRD